MVDAHTHIDQYGDDMLKALDQIKNLSIRTLAVSMDLHSFRKHSKLPSPNP